MKVNECDKKTTYKFALSRIVPLHHCNIRVLLFESLCLHISLNSDVVFLLNESSKWFIFDVIVVEEVCVPFQQCTLSQRAADNDRSLGPLDEMLIRY